MSALLNFGKDAFLKWALLLCIFQTVFAQGNDASGITPGASLAGTSVSKLSSKGGVRNIVIEITNHLDTALIGGENYLKHGVDKTPPPTRIMPMTVEAIQFDKKWDTATGTAGILSYRVDDNRDSATFVIAFSVPVDYVVSNNWFGLTFVDRDTTVDKSLYDKLYDEHDGRKNREDKKFAYASDGKPISVFHKDYTVSASMSNVGKSTLKVDVQKRAESDGKNHRNRSL